MVDYEEDYDGEDFSIQFSYEEWSHIAAALDNQGWNYWNYFRAGQHDPASRRLAREMWKMRNTILSQMTYKHEPEKRS